MPRPKSSVPTYRHHRASGQAVVTLDGRVVYLGPWKSAASRREYDRVVREWMARGRSAPADPSTEITVGELLVRYFRWAKAYYRGGSREVDTSGAAWIYTPARHKTQYHGHSRTIHLGPRAQEILKPWFRTMLEEYLFQPKEAAEWLREQRAARRKTPLSYGNRAGTNRRKKPQRVPGQVYKVGAYCRAITRGCEKADVPSWHPHQLRHNAATWLRKEFGLDAARVILGHRSPTITELYAELDAEKAAEIMGRVG